MTSETQPKTPPGKQENMLINLLFNIVLPAIILSKLSPENRLGPVYALIVGLSLPLGYGIYDLVTRKKWNFFSILGFISILLTGGLGLLKVDGIWFAVKEAAIPLLLGIAVICSLKTKYPLVRTFLYNDQIIDVDKVHRTLVLRDNENAFDKLLVSSTYVLAFSFLLSAILNFILARVILKSPSGSVEFTQELGKMTALSWPVIVIPSTIVMAYALWRLFAGIKRLTGLGMEDVFKTPPPKEK
jgi:hypothetical protein